ncbi:MAG: tripartite tricarboxylate transporter TctB family protein [Desulfobacteraceae bacterium]|nr:MAG: tripartite tricarboxylate transporter TctB family protein [Desulfobacteraceae bacterium]
MVNENQHSASRAHDLFGMLLGLFALFMLITIKWQIDTSGPDPFYKGPMIFPLIILLIMLAGSIPSMWRMIKPLPGSSWYLDGDGIPYRTIAVAVLLAFFPLGLTYLGLEISTWLFLFTGLQIVKQNALPKLIGIPLGITAAIYLVFKLFLDIWFPTPLLFELLME